MLWVVVRGFRLVKILLIDFLCCSPRIMECVLKSSYWIIVCLFMNEGLFLVSGYVIESLREF